MRVNSMPSLEKQKSKLEDSKRKLREKEKMLKEKEKRSSQNTLSNLGRLIVKAQISHMDSEALIGALLEISEMAKDDKNISSWKEKAQKHKANDKTGKAITISFKKQPEAEIREKLKELNFKWHAFRKEYYGFCEKDAVSDLLKNHECKIETIEISE